MNYLKSNNNPKIIELSKTDDKRGYFIKSFNKSKTDKLIPFDIIHVGERIRDLVYLEEDKKIIFLLENSPSIAVIQNDK